MTARLVHFVKCCYPVWLVGRQRSPDDFVQAAEIEDKSNTSKVLNRLSLFDYP